MKKLPWLVVLSAVLYFGGSIAIRGDHVPARTAAYAAGLEPAVRETPRPIPKSALVRILLCCAAGAFILFFVVLAVGAVHVKRPSREDFDDLLR